MITRTLAAALIVGAIVPNAHAATSKPAASKRNENPARDYARTDAQAKVLLARFENGRKPTREDLRLGVNWMCSSLSIRKNDEGRWSKTSYGPEETFNFDVTGDLYTNAPKNLKSDSSNHLPPTFTETDRSILGEQGREETYIRIDTKSGNIIASTERYNAINLRSCEPQGLSSDALKEFARRDVVARELLKQYDAAAKPVLSDLQPGRRWDCSSYTISSGEGGTIKASSASSSPWFRFGSAAQGNFSNEASLSGQAAPSLFVAGDRGILGTTLSKYSAGSEFQLRVASNHDLLGVIETSYSLSLLSCLSDTRTSGELDAVTKALSDRFDAGHLPSETELQLGKVWVCGGQHDDFGVAENTSSSSRGSMLNFRPNGPGLYTNVGALYQGTYATIANEGALGGYSFPSQRDASETRPSWILIRADEAGNLIVKHSRETSVDFWSCAKDQAHAQ